MHDITRHNVAIIYSDEQKVKLYQANMFESFRKKINNKARMFRGDKRGHIRDSWIYDTSKQLESYTTYQAFRVRNASDANQLTGKGITKFIFLDVTLDSSTLNHLYSQLSNVEGFQSFLPEVLLQEPNAPKYSIG